MFFLSMAGHVITLYRGAEKPVDYKDGRRPHRVKQEFSPNHRYDPVFLLVINDGYDNCCNLAIYFPIMSNSRLTIDPTRISQKLVCSIVYGMIAT